MLFFKSHNGFFINIQTTLTKVIDIFFANLSKRRKRNILHQNYVQSIFITSKSTLNKKNESKGEFLSGPTLVLKSVEEGLKGITKQYFVEDWSLEKIFEFTKYICKFNNSKSLICGITSSKLLLAKIFNPKSHFVLILMNANNSYRLEQLKKSYQYHKVPVLKEEVPFPPFLQSLLIFLADKVLLIGNSHTLSSYTNKRWEGELFRIANAQIDSEFFNTKSNKNNFKNDFTFCFPASMHGHRKGLFYTIFSWIKFFKEIKLLKKDLPNLILTGKLPKSYDEFLKKQYGDSFKKNFNIDIRGWVSAKDLKAIYLKSKYLIAVPLEEGQVAAVLEAIAFGISPIISKDTGITLKKYNYINNFYSGNNLSLYKALLNSYLRGEFKNEDPFLNDNKRKKFIDYYSRKSVYNSFMSIFG